MHFASRQNVVRDSQVFLDLVRNVHVFHDSPAKARP
jgi:hypothetical protein